MKVSEAIKQIRNKACNDKCTEIHCGDSCMYGKDKCAFGIAIQSLEMQEKLKQWIEGYKRQEFADMTLTRDGLIDILNEFRLECEKPMKEVTVVMNVQVTKILKNVPDCFGMDEEALKKEMISEIKSAGYDDAVVEDMKVFEGGAEYDK